MTTCGTGGWNGPKAGDPDNNVVLSASPAFGGIEVVWTYPAVNPYAVAHVKLFRSGTNDFNSAIQIAIVAGNHYYDKVNANIQYFYWIQIVSINGTEGQVVGPAAAFAKALIADFITELTGKIDAGILASSLRASLDQISIIDANLLNEITSRENDSVTLAQAVADAQAGVAQANTFITQVNNSRIADNQAIAEQINLVAAAQGADYGAVIQSMTVDIDSLNGTVDAMYTAKVNVNGLIGGFGIHNDGTTVDAGFDVDTFWVGKTQANKRKPFIIKDGVVYMNEAVIDQLTFTKLRTENGNFVVNGAGQVYADYIDTKGMVIRDTLGNPVFSAGMGLDWTRITNKSAANSFVAENTWDFRGDGLQWNPIGLTVQNFDNIVRLTYSTVDAHFQSPGLAIDGRYFNKIRARIKRVSGTSPWEGNIYWKTTWHDYLGQYLVTTPNTNNLNEWHIVEWDMSTSNDWNTSTITGFMVDLVNASGDTWDIDWIAIGATAEGKTKAQIGNNVVMPDGSVLNQVDFVNKLAKIGSGNISTFMEAAAIGNAYIGNAEISTLKIQGNAVTVPIHVAIGSGTSNIEVGWDGRNGSPPDGTSDFGPFYNNEGVELGSFYMPPSGLPTNDIQHNIIMVTGRVGITGTYDAQAAAYRFCVFEDGTPIKDSGWALFTSAYFVLTVIVGQNGDVGRTYSVRMKSRNPGTTTNGANGALMILGTRR